MKSVDASLGIRRIQIAIFCTLSFNYYNCLSDRSGKIPS